MEIIEKSLQIALLAYSGLSDKGGQPYILHPLRMMAKMESHEEMSVALLHDVLEDSSWTSADLLKVGIPVNIVEAVICLSRKQKESYEEFIQRTKKNALAKKIKIADLEDNMNILRLSQLESKDLQRLSRYHKAWKELTQS